MIKTSRTTTRRLLSTIAAAATAVPLLIAVPGTARAAGPGAAQALPLPTICSTGVTYGVNASGAAIRYRMITPMDGGQLENLGQISTGWQNYARVFAGSQYDFYAVKADGLYYARSNDAGVWPTPTKISSSFGFLANAADRNQASIDTQGWFWVVDNAGLLKSYKYDHETNTWANGGISKAHDTGWNRYNLIVATAGGVLYGRDATDGTLHRSQYDRNSGRWLERHVQVSGSDWRPYKSLSSYGADTLIVTHGTTGEARYYRFDPDTRTWPVNRFLAGTGGWQNMRDVVSEPDRCRPSWYPIMIPRPALTQSTFTPSAVTQLSNGALELAHIDNIGRLVHGRMPDPSDVNTVQWTTISGNEAFTGKPALGEHANGRVSISALNLSSDMWQRNQLAASGADWGPWDNQSGRVKESPVKAKTPAGLLTQFSLDADGAPWYRSQGVANGDFNGWNKLDGTGLTGPLTAVTVRNGIQLFAKNASGVLSTARYSEDGSVTAWTPLGAQAINGSAAAVVYPGYRLRVFATDGNGKVVTAAQATENGAYGAWSQVGDLTVDGSPSALISPQSGLTEVVAKGADGTIHSTGETIQGSGTWRNWQQVSAETSGTAPTTFNWTTSTGPSWAFVYRTVNHETRLSTVNPFLARGAGKAVTKAPSFTTRTLPAPK
ncbi:tachylectin-related carbohydrate-binding protein [Streptomyces sp. NPDC020965]|uniref:tachylectin-related carbohydrate-binding protein n=1 Tax=Streptomyces sp. NPDC020965 TaxID=3365105 RepID=UPI0037984303